MLNSLKETGKTLGREISRAWESLSEGWRELLSRSGNALTHFSRRKEDEQQASSELTIEGNMLHLSGEKRFERETSDSTYHVMERAYGAFQRSIALPRNVNIDKAQASFKNGVLTVRLPKQGSDKPRSISVS